MAGAIHDPELRNANTSAEGVPADQRNPGTSFVSLRDAVRCTSIDLAFGAPDASSGGFAANLERHDLIFVAVDDVRRDVELVQIGPKIGGGECGGALGYHAVPSLHALQPECVPHPARSILVLPIDAEERPIGQTL